MQFLESFYTALLYSYESALNCKSAVQLYRRLMSKVVWNYLQMYDKLTIMANGKAKYEMSFHFPDFE